ncbi:MAG: porphobilinogen synthase [Nitrososphaeraceae archaeon]
MSRVRRVRQRRIQKNRSLILKMLMEIGLRREQLIMPLIIYENRKINKDDIIPGAVYDCETDIVYSVRKGLEVGINSFILFGVPDRRDSRGTGASDSHGIVQRSVRKIKKEFGDQVEIITDVCVCQYNLSGHCGLTEYHNNIVDNDTTLDLLCEIALSHAESGADMVSPSSMMDGQVYRIRSSLNEKGFKNVKIMSFSAKHSSNLYAPFRTMAFTSNLQTRPYLDKSTYQLSFSNKREALREIEADINEGADIVMVKPSLAYLDLLPMIRDNIGDFPLAVQVVSGEFAMIRAASLHKWIDESEWTVYSIASTRRAGADRIITYSSIDIAEYLK